MDIINFINQTAEHLKPEDIPKLVPNLIESYQVKIDRYAVRAYGADRSNYPLICSAFTEKTKEVISNALNTFLFKREHWRTGRDINSYLLLCIKRLAEQIYWDQSAAKKTNALICPVCREYGQKVFLLSESRNWRCNNCTSEIDLLNKQISSTPISKIPALKAKINLHKSFSLHSRKGYKCPELECGRFIPYSLIGDYGIQCPYPDCPFFGEVDELQIMSHPSSITSKNVLSLNKKDDFKDGKEGKCELQDHLESETVQADDKMVINETFDREYSVLMSVIHEQMNLIERMSGERTKRQKTLMYQAYLNLAQMHKEDMVSYLVHLNQSGDSPIQARIFQEYIRLVENNLPFSIKKNGEMIEILSLGDSDFGLFAGISVFNAIVDAKGCIPNNTLETYVGSREYKMHGNCFLGKLIDVQDTEGNSVLSHIKGYDFSQIETNLKSGTKVIVSHYRIPAHYEIGHLTYLQRIRRNLVDRIYFKINGKKRQVRK